jgi:hypothetical protein
LAAFGMGWIAGNALADGAGATDQSGGGMGTAG